jgi:hypothetical protein
MRASKKTPLGKSQTYRAVFFFDSGAGGLFRGGFRLAR